MSTSRFVALMVWVIASVFYAYQYLLRVMPSIMIGDIMQQFSIDAGTFGQFSGVYYLGYSLLHLPIGILLDRYGPRKVMSGCILLTVAGLLPIIFAENWIYPIAGRFLIGIGSSAAILGTFKIIRMTFSEKHFTRMLSLSVMIGLIGAIYGGGPVSYMSEMLGYQAVVKIMAAMGVLLAAITYVVVPEMESTNKTTVIADIKEVLGNSKVVLSCMFAGMMVGPLEGFADVWGAGFLKQVYGFSPTMAASLPSMIFIGMCFGAPVLSLVAEKTGNYLGTIIGAGIIMAVAFFALINGQLSSGAISFSFVLIGICSAYQILAIYKASTYVPEHVAGLTTAVANMIIMVFGYAFHTVMGGVVSAMGGTENAVAYEYAISVIPMALSIGVLGFSVLYAKEYFRVKQEAV